MTPPKIKCDLCDDPSTGGAFGLMLCAPCRDAYPRAMSSLVMKQRLHDEMMAAAPEMKVTVEDIEPTPEKFTDPETGENVEVKAGDLLQGGDGQVFQALPAREAEPPKPILGTTPDRETGENVEVRPPGPLDTRDGFGLGAWPHPNDPELKGVTP